MNNILKYIKENKKISDLLFYVSEIVDKNTDTSLWIRNKYKKDLKEVKWIYISKLQDFNLIGVENINNKSYVVAIDTQEEQVWVNNFQDIPYEIYRRHFGIYESDRKEYVHKLKEYEQWCRDNNIVVDPNNYYHDENKDIFKEYFEVENYYDQDIITRNL